jgi:hypothetical protein
MSYTTRSPDALLAAHRGAGQVARIPLTGPVAVRFSGPGMPGALW